MTPERLLSDKLRYLRNDKEDKLGGMEPES
ncbi:uncharacterized protein G2W53_022734 [Senna tora]|uniref:Uncharacterized protein n=1 Tax=Senna tora TaxID=362788 RepID=A0A834TQ56_9FABA|nr:uncharacterized protein G2W53_022734 [Senna tora]